MKVLVTRPQGKGEALVAKLKTVVDGAYLQPVMAIEHGPDMEKLPKTWLNCPPDFLIFVSTFAVDHFILALKEPKLLEQSQTRVLAVGQSTANRLNQWTNVSVTVPKLETSEGLLALPQLQKSEVAGKKVVIVRGVDGRELLSEQLQANGAQVEYWQLYERIVISDQGQHWFEQWQAQQIDVIVVTSVAILKAIFDSLPNTAHDWLLSRKWIVASHRIAECAMQLGIAEQSITDAQGASDEAILAQVHRLIEK